MIKRILTPNGTELLVEIDETFLEGESAIVSNDSVDTYVGAKGGLGEDIINAATASGSMLENQLRGLSELIRSSTADLKASETSVEAHIKFGGKVSAIPFFASGAGDGGIKIKLTWKD